MLQDTLDRQAGGVFGYGPRSSDPRRHAKKRQCLQLLVPHIAQVPSEYHPTCAHEGAEKRAHYALGYDR